MSVVRKLLGTIEDRFWLFQDTTSNLQGVYAVNPDGAHIEFRDADDVFIRLSGADGVDPEDYATMNQIGGGGGGGTEWIGIPVVFGDAGNPVSSTANVPTGAYILEARVLVTAPFDDGSGAPGSTPVPMPLSAEVAGVGTNFLEQADSDTGQEADFIVAASQLYAGAPAIVTVTCAASAAARGAATVLVKYSVPLA